jgi:hypothetical protein
VTFAMSVVLKFCYRGSAEVRSHMLLKPSQYEPFSRELRYLGREPRLYAASEERRVGVSAAHDAEARLQS